MSGPPQGAPPWVTAGSRPPPGVLSSLFGGSSPTGLAGPPTSVLEALSGLTKNPPASATAPPPGLSLPSSGFTGLPAGFTPPPGMTGPPAGFSLPPGMTGPPPGIPTDGMSPNENPYVAILHKMILSPEQSELVSGVTAMFLVLCFAAVAGRLLARRLSRVRIEIDDWISVGAFMCFLALAITHFIMSHYGSMTSTEPLGFNMLRNFKKVQFSSEIIYSFVTCAAKASVLALYRRLFSLRTKWFRILWWICVGVNAAFFVELLVVQITPCLPVSRAWNEPLSCRPDLLSMGINGFINAAIDIAILVLPIRTVWLLQITTRQKWAINGVFGLGLVAVAISLARAIIVISPSAFKTGGINFVMWSTAEPAVALICSCLPVLRPLYTSSAAKLGSKRPWNWYSSKQSQSRDSPGASGGQYAADQNLSKLAESTLRSTPTSTNTAEKSWMQTSDAELGIKSCGDSDTQSPISPFDKPLPPEYGQLEGDTGYHTWSWNLLSRPRDENKAPTISRSTMIKENGHPFRAPSISPKNGSRTSSANSKRSTSKRWMSKIATPPRLETQTPILDRSPNTGSPVSVASRASPLPTSEWRTASTPQNQNSTSSPNSDGWAFRSHPTSDRPLASSPTHSDSSNQPLRPRPVPRTESVRRKSPMPKLSVRTGSQSNATSQTSSPLSRRPSHVSNLTVSPSLSNASARAIRNQQQQEEQERPDSHEMIWHTTTHPDSGSIPIPIRIPHPAPPLTPGSASIPLGIDLSEEIPAPPPPPILDRRPPSHWSPSLYPLNTNTHTEITGARQIETNREVHMQKKAQGKRKPSRRER